MGTIFLGTEGTMIIPDYSSYYTVLGRKREEGPSAFEEGSPISDLPHFRNWVLAFVRAVARSCRLKLNRGICLPHSVIWPTSLIALTER